jgi:hypothetical protein
VHPSAARTTLRSSAFAGVHPRKAHLPLTAKAAVKTEQVSANRWHLDVKLAVPGDLDAELLAWLRGWGGLQPNAEVGLMPLGSREAANPAEIVGRAILPAAAF